MLERGAVVLGVPFSSETEAMGGLKPTIRRQI